MRTYILFPALLLAILLIPIQSSFASDSEPGDVMPSIILDAKLLDSSRLAAWKGFQDEDEAPPVTTLPDIKFERPAFNEMNLRDSTGLDIDLTLHGDIWAYSVWNTGTNHIERNSYLMETVLRAGVDFQYGNAFGGQFRVVGTDVHKRPEERTMPRSTDFATRIDLANLSLTGAIGNLESTMTVGLQELGYGDGLLVWDGFSEKRAVWANPIRSFPAIRWATRLDTNYTLDLFTALVHHDYLNYEAYIVDKTRVETGGMVSGANFNAKTDLLGETDIGIFYKYDDAADEDPLGQDTGSNTYAASIRDCKKISKFTFTGELIYQWGRTKVVANSLTNERQDRSAWGGHITARFDFIEDDENSAWLKGRWAQFQGDRTSTSTVEAFDPFLGGYEEWGNWYLGNITSFFYPNTNKRVIQLEAGAVPFDETQIRAIYYDISLDQKLPYSGSPQWSNEVNIIFDYYPCDYAFVGCLIGMAFPEGAAKRFYGDSETQTEIAIWAGLTF